MLVKSMSELVNNLIYHDPEERTNIQFFDPNFRTFIVEKIFKWEPWLILEWILSHFRVTDCMYWTIMNWRNWRHGWSDPIPQCTFHIRRNIAKLSLGQNPTQFDCAGSKPNFSKRPPTRPAKKVWRRYFWAMLTKQKLLVYMGRPQNSFGASYTDYWSPNLVN